MSILLNSFKTWAFYCIIYKLRANVHFSLARTFQGRLVNILKVLELEYNTTTIKLALEY